MYAIIKTGGKQYKVEKGDVIAIEKLEAAIGDTVSFDVLMLVNGDAVKVGKPTVAGSIVKAKVVEHGKGEKILIFKYKSKKNYRKSQGHRQPFTKVEVLAVE